MDRRQINREWAQHVKPDWSHQIANMVVHGLFVGRVLPEQAFGHAVTIVAANLDAFVATNGAMSMSDTQEDQEKTDQAWSDRAAAYIIDAVVTEKLVAESGISRAISIAAEEILVWIRMEARPAAFYTGLFDKK